MVFVAAQRIGQRIIAHVYQQVKIRASNRFQNHSLCFSGAKAGHLCAQQVGISLVAGKRQRILVLAFSFRTPFHQILIDLLAQRLTALHGDDSERTNGDGFKISFFFAVAHA